MFYHMKLFFLLFTSKLIPIPMSTVSRLSLVEIGKNTFFFVFVFGFFFL